MKESEVYKDIPHKTGVILSKNCVHFIYNNKGQEAMLKFYDGDENVIPENFNNNMENYLKILEILENTVT